MGCKIEVLFTPAEFEALPRRELGDTGCVVFDVLRATSTIVTALANGAAAFIPVAEISEALLRRRAQPDALLAGERHGLRIGAELTGGIEFDLGNSPREFTAGKVEGRTIISTTTNGTRALRACAHAESVVAGSFLNLQATAGFVVATKTKHLLLICAGTREYAALEDALAAGALCERLVASGAPVELRDSAEIARRVYREAASDLSTAVRSAQNARLLLANADLRDDVAFCLRRDCYALTAALGPDGAVRKRTATPTPLASRR
jgi:2-phosphosulfolactate phosphatase